MTQRVYLTKEQVDKRKACHALLAKPSATPITNRKELPENESLLEFCPEPYDQGKLGSCTANAFCGAYRIMANRFSLDDAGWEPSRLWVYYWERVLESPQGTDRSTMADTGGDVIDAESYVKTHGVCSEHLFPYNIKKFDAKPSHAAIEDAKKHKISGYATIPVDENLTTAIESHIAAGWAVLIAVSLYKSFESDEVAKSGMVPLPNPQTYNDPKDPQDPFIGGHEMLIVGYDRQSQLFLVRNSWGKGWGESGNCYVPYDYLTNSNLGIEFTIISS